MSMGATSTRATTSATGAGASVTTRTRHVSLRSKSTCATNRAPYRTRSAWASYSTSAARPEAGPMAMRTLVGGANAAPACGRYTT